MVMVGRRGLLLSASGALLAASAGVGLAACNGSKGNSGPSPDDMSLGNPNAPAKLIEYASLTCPHCEEFEKEVFDRLKTNYIDTGKVYFTLREFPAPAALAPIAVAEFQLARCGGVDANTYFTRVNALFAQREAILATGTMDGVRQKLIEFGASAGLNEQQVMACITDETGAQRVQRIVEAGERDFDITGTPTLILNGQKLTDPSTVTYDGLTHAIDAAIAGAH
ncbi:MAG TPA: thioredoxin domain-containing protein [Caulobacterales bacterium]|nr:thioredoxin domain-containing protein [Caulobacterales bacterium]